MTEKDKICNNNCVYRKTLKENSIKCIFSCGLFEYTTKYKVIKNVPCIFFRNEIKKNNLLDRLGNIPYISITDINYNNIELIKIENDKYVSGFYNIFNKVLITSLQAGNNLWFYGATGSGKTTIAFSILYEFFIKNIQHQFEYFDCFKYDDIKSIKPAKYGFNSGVTLIDEMYLNSDNEKLLLKYIDWKKNGINPIVFTSNFIPGKKENSDLDYAIQDARILDRLQLIQVLIICKQSYRSLKDEVCKNT